MAWAQVNPGVLNTRQLQLDLLPHLSPLSELLGNKLKNP